MLKYLLVRKPNYMESHFLQDFRSHFIVFCLFFMDFSIQLNNQLFLMAVKVSNEKSFFSIEFSVLNEVLPGEFLAEKPPVPDFLPEGFLGQGLVFAKCASKFKDVFVFHARVLTPPWAPSCSFCGNWGRGGKYQGL